MGRGGRLLRLNRCRGDGGRGLRHNGRLVSDGGLVGVQLLGLQHLAEHLARIARSGGLNVARGAGGLAIGERIFLKLAAFGAVAGGDARGLVGVLGHGKSSSQRKGS